jgi:hypothetical protein
MQKTKVLKLNNKLTFLKNKKFYILVCSLFTVACISLICMFLYTEHKQKELLDYQIKCSTASNLLLDRIPEKREELKNLKVHFSTENKGCYLYFETEKETKKPGSIFNDLDSHFLGDRTYSKNIYNAFNGDRLGELTKTVWIDEHKERVGGFFNANKRINFTSEKDFNSYAETLLNN